MPRPLPIRPGRLLAGVLALVGCGLRDATPAAAPLVAPACPDGAAAVVVGDDLQARIDAAAPGSALTLAPGRHAGPVVMRQCLTLHGPADAVIVGAGAGCTVQVDAAGVRLLGFTVDGSGSRYDKLDAAIRVHADDVTVEGVTVRNALFGVLVEQAARVTLRGNRVQGTGAAALGLRGDTIRLWETNDCTIEANTISDGRDMVVWYSNRTRVLGNTIEGGRYGTHFMYTREPLVERNRYIGNVVGIFVMYSHDVALRANTISRCAGAAGIAIGVKESGNLVVADNRLLANTVGLFVDTSPLDRVEHNRIEGNVFGLSRTAVAFHGGAAGNRFARNIFRDNQIQVRVDGGSDAMAADWSGNRWDDYQGYDLDGDGTGDVAYEVGSLSGQLTATHPLLEFLHGTPTLFLVDLTGRVLPIFRPQVLLRDATPSVALTEADDAR